MLTFATIAAALKTAALYRIVKIFTDRKLNLEAPFNEEFAGFVLALSQLTFAIGVASYLGTRFMDWIASQNVAMPIPEILRLAGADVWLFMSVTLYVIALIFKRGVEMQRENELTI
ncbi:MAG: DUF2975 domain-containing protein [Proteobacteria bacterium]|nr:MAG: DUF2975 domain-containing protein [Pseudomonadota bacterium]